MRVKEFKYRCPCRVIRVQYVADVLIINCSSREFVADVKDRLIIRSTCAISCLLGGFRELNHST